MKRYLIFALLFIVVCPLFGQEDYTIKRIVFLPPKFFVGDQVELRIQFSFSEDKTVSPPSSFPDLDWLHFNRASLNTSGNEAELSLLFAAYYPGTRALPDITLGEITLRGIKIHTASVVSTDNKNLAPLRNQVLIPGTVFYIASFMAIIIVFPLVSIPVVRGTKKFLKSAIHKNREGRIHRKLQREVQKIRDQIETLDSRTFYILLTEQTRLYLARKTGKDFITATSREMYRLLSACFKNFDLTDKIAEFFRKGDLAKFAGTISSRDERTDSIDVVIGFVAEIENHYSILLAREEG